MLKPEENERLCRVGPGTPMGKVFRSYWLPALLSEELPEPDCPPVRVRLLGEDLIAFRDTEGRIGLLERYCPHRLTDLFLGRNEECGLRCVYHGWKFDVEGHCVDMPNEPPESTYKEKVTLQSYPTYEKGGVVWTYMGSPDQQPPVPDYEWMRVPQTHSFVGKTFEEANWLQALEGGIDTAHSSFAHNNNLKVPGLRARATAPKLEVEKQEWGFTYLSVRDLKEEGKYIRGYQFVMPMQQMRGWITKWQEKGLEEFPTVDGHLWVPVDDENTCVYNWMYAIDDSYPFTQEYVKRKEAMLGRAPEDLLPGYRLKRNLSNDYLIDREKQRTMTYTGIDGINTQDYAMQESMPKPFPDRSKEHLSSTDAAIIVARQLLLEATYDVEKGKWPRGVDPKTHRMVRGADYLYSNDVDWREAISKEMVAKW